MINYIITEFIFVIKSCFTHWSNFHGINDMVKLNLGQIFYALVRYLPKITNIAYVPHVLVLINSKPSDTYMHQKISPLLFYEPFLINEMHLKMVSGTAKCEIFCFRLNGVTKLKWWDRIYKNGSHRKRIFMLWLRNNMFVCVCTFEHYVFLWKDQNFNHI